MLNHTEKKSFNIHKSKRRNIKLFDALN